MILEKIPEIGGLTLDEKIKLAEESWESIASERDPYPIDEEHLKILNERIRDYETNPQNVKTWEAVKSDLRKKFGQQD